MLLANGHIQACEWALKKKSGNVVVLAGNGSLANSTATTRMQQLDCDNSTVDKLYRLYADCKDKSSVKTTIF